MPLHRAARSQPVKALAKNWRPENDVGAFSVRRPGSGSFIRRTRLSPGPGMGYSSWGLAQCRGMGVMSNPYGEPPDG